MPVDKGRKLNWHKTFNLGPVSTGMLSLQIYFPGWRLGRRVDIQETSKGETLDEWLTRQSRGSHSRIKNVNVTSIYVASLLEILVMFQELEAALHKYSEKTIFWKHAAKLQLNNKTEERFQ